MKRWWLGLALLAPLVTAVACGDDDVAPDPNHGADGGADAPTYTPPAPALPLRCASAGTFDPCDAGLDPSVFGATQPDGGAIANVDAGGYADAGFVASACVATGAVRIACDDAGAARFDLAAGDGGTSHAVAFGQQASRFDIDPSGGTSAMTALAPRNELRIVSSPAGVAVLSARGGNTDITAQREGAKTYELASLGGSVEDPPFYGAGMGDDGTIYALYHAHGNNFWRQPLRDPNDTSYRPNLSPVFANVLYVGSNGFQLAGQDFGRFDVFRPGSTDHTMTVSAPGLGTLFAAGISPEGALVAGYDDAAYDNAQVEVFIGHELRDPSFTRVRIEREPRCGLHQTGCGYTCMETRRTALGGGSFVHLANGKDYLVYGEATVTSERKYAIGYTVSCGLFGGCACLSKTEVRSVGDVDAVVMQVTTDPDQLIERARAHLVLTDPKNTLLAAKPGAGLRATARENQIHVLLQGSANEMARVVIDLGK